MNRQPYGTPPKWWAPKLSPWCVRVLRGWRRWRLGRQQKIEQVVVEQGDYVRQALKAGQGVMLTPNHSVHYDSAALYLAADEIGTPLYYLTAWQVFGMSAWWDQWFMQHIGCYSIDRESVDRQAFKQSIQVLQHEPYPLVVFPEGDIYHTTDRVTPFREGAAAMALSAAKRATRTVSVIPCGIKFWYLEDPTANMQAAMTQLEQRVLLRPEPTRPLAERIYRLAGAVLALKELDYLGNAASGPVESRIANLTQHVLASLEARYVLAAADHGVPERVKSLRQKVIQRIESEDRPPNAAERGQLHADMEDLFFVMQLYSYPGDYLANNPSIERLAETFDKMEEDILGLDLPNVRGRRIAQIRFGEPIAIAAGEARRDVSELTILLRDRVQGLIDGMNADGIPMHR